MITKEQLDAWRKLAEEATPNGIGMRVDNKAVFITIAREAVPALIAEVERLQNRCEAYEEEIAGLIENSKKITRMVLG